MTKQARRLYAAVTLAWIFFILFPFYSIRRFSANYQVAFDWVFHTHASHVLMHTFLYAVLGWFLCALFFRPMRSVGRLLFFVLLAVAMVAGLQEAIQMICERVTLGGDEIFDFFVDLNGGILGIMLFVQKACRRIISRERPFPLGVGVSVKGRPKNTVST